MPLVKYVANLDPSDGTSVLNLALSEEGEERVLRLNGDPLEVTDGELALVRSRFVVEEVESDEESSSDDEKAEKDEKPPAAFDARQSSEPTPSPTVDVGSAPSSSQSQPPTPPAGN